MCVIVTWVQPVNGAGKEEQRARRCCFQAFSHHEQMIWNSGSTDLNLKSTILLLDSFSFIVKFLALQATGIMWRWEGDPGRPPGEYSWLGIATQEQGTTHIISDSPPNVSRSDSGASSGWEIWTMAYWHLTADLSSLPLCCKWNSAAGSARTHTHTRIHWLNLCLQ